MANENMMIKSEAVQRIDELIFQYAKGYFGDDAFSIITKLKNGGKTDGWEEAPIQTAIEASKDVSDDPVRNYYICQYVDFYLTYQQYEGVLYNEGLL